MTGAAFDLRAYDPAGPVLLDEIVELLSRSYGRPWASDRVQRFLDLQPDGWVNALEGDTLVAVGGCIAYPSGGFGWIGLVGTDPAHERRGAGRAVTQWLVDRLAAHGCASVLDASAAGEPVYRRMGFADHGVTTEALAPGDGPAAPPAPALRAAVPVTDADWPELVAFDTDCFGADRSHLLSHLRRSGAPVVVVRSADGRLVGHGVGQSNVTGPVAAENADALAAIISALTIGAGAPGRLLVPSGSAHLDTLHSWGWTTGRALAHQRLGIDALPGRRHLLAGQTTFGEG